MVKFAKTVPIPKILAPPIVFYPCFPVEWVLMKVGASLDLAFPWKINPFVELME